MHQHLMVNPVATASLSRVKFGMPVSTRPTGASGERRVYERGKPPLYVSGRTLDDYSRIKAQMRAKELPAAEKAALQAKLDQLLIPDVVVSAQRLKEMRLGADAPKGAYRGKKKLS
jgi:hypothetical protein